MAVVGKQITVGTSATKVADNGFSSDQIKVILRNNDAATSVFLGGPTVAASGGSGGYELKFGVSQEFSLDAGETLYAIVATGTVRVDALTSG
jgi:hypothetical protein